MATVALVAHDAGGAEILSSWARRTDQPCLLVAEGPARAIFARKCPNLAAVSLAEAVPAADWLLCGSGWQSTLERAAIRTGRSAGKKTVTFLDHWVNYRQRFEEDGRLDLPDELWVGDDDAFEIAKATFPGMRIVLHDNPFVLDLLDDIAKAAATPQSTDQAGSILYVCEPVAEHAKKAKGDPRHFGYTEHDALRFFLDNVDRLDGDGRDIVIRPHPSETAEKYAWALAEPRRSITMGGSASLIAEILAADVVVGCESMALVVALLAGKRVVSSIPSGGRPCQLPHAGIERLADLGQTVREPKRCLVVGLGQIGAGYDIDANETGGIYTHARALSLHPDFVLIGGVDPVEAQRQRFEAKYRVPAYEDTGEAMRLTSPEVVVVATPAHLHLASIQKVLANGRPEVVLCEKPLAFDQAEGEAIVDLCRQEGIELFVNYIRRSDPGVLEIGRRILAGKIATPVKGAFWYSKGLFNNGSHFLNLLQFWLGRVEAFDVLSPGRMWDGNDPEPDVHLRFERGAVVLQSAWEEAFSFYGGELLSPTGRLAYEDGGSVIRWRSRLAGFGSTGLAPDVEYIHNDMDRYQWNVCEQLARFLSGRPWDLCSGNEALATLKVISAIARHDEVGL